MTCGSGWHIKILQNYNGMVLIFPCLFGLIGSIPLVCSVQFDRSVRSLNISSTFIEVSDPVNPRLVQGIGVAGRLAYAVQG